MKIAFQLAYKNLIGAGLRTWLNVIVLSFAFVMIVFFNGFIDGWNQQASLDGIAWEYGNGQLRNENFDPHDPFSLQDAHGVLPGADEKGLIPVLIRQATIYPHGRMMSIVLKGISAEQTLLKLPTQLFRQSRADFPAIIGKRMALSANLQEGDEFLLRWRDKNGTFDAANITIAGIFDSQVPTVDAGQIWIPIDKLWQITGYQDHATLYVATEKYIPEKTGGWTFENRKALLKELTDIINMKKASGSVMYGLLLAIALLAIFDTQVLSIFRRQREIGTYIAMGMTRWQVVLLFTTEGSMYSFLATLLGTAYGAPILGYFGWKGIGMPEVTQNMGVALAERIFPVYGLGLIVTTVLLVVIASTVVSFLPSRKIAKMNPVDALKGKLQ